MKLRKQDNKHLTRIGLKPGELASQLDLLYKGTQPVKLKAPATPGNGIIQLTPQQAAAYAKKFSGQASTLSVTRFVPASGAASRMFKAFYQYLNDGIENPEIKKFAQNFQQLAFYGQIKCTKAPDYNCAINNMINVLKLAQLPKALIPFHLYDDGPRTAFEEHLVEAALILNDSKTIHIHFTISAGHHQKFVDKANAVLPRYEQQFNCRYNLGFSYQSPATDTVAVDENHQLVRNDQGKLLFRPGGHGALLHNLNELTEDLIFIKNIDNVQPDHIKEDTVFYKKVLAGLLIDSKNKLHELLSDLEKFTLTPETIARIASQELQLKLPKGFAGYNQDKQRRVLSKLPNRPIRVCGMVKNESEPGGGPFWVIDKHGAETLQIIESSQIDHQDAEQAAIAKQSTHFNPVDIACWVKDYRGRPFNLHHFTDPDTSFVTVKSYNGKNIKVLEHPGLWNGGMANWLTFFVEVPLTTFSPVKTLTDLLKKQHQASRAL